MNDRLDERTAQLRDLLADDGRPEDERERLIRLMLLFAQRPMPEGLGDFAPDHGTLRDRFVATLDGADGEAAEEAFLTLYAHVHGHEAPYTEEERRRVDETGGYWCHAGGLSPVLKAGPWIRPDTVLGDFGAGNGLQGLLMQWLHPHRLTIQIEISQKMIEIGRRLQAWLDIPEDRVEWVCGDVLDASPAGMDFIYIYRPVRPVGEGLKFYEKFGAELARTTHPVVIFSIADCLGPFLPDHFDVIHGDGHLTCYRRSMATRG
jgi:hypothetical protein